MTEHAIALVTGTNKGLGLETCRQLARRNITVLMGARDMEKGREAADSLQSEGLAVEPVQLDVTRADHMAQAKHLIDIRFGRLDINDYLSGLIPIIVIKPAAGPADDPLPVSHTQMRCPGHSRCLCMTGSYGSSCLNQDQSCFGT